MAFVALKADGSIVSWGSTMYGGGLTSVGPASTVFAGTTSVRANKSYKENVPKTKTRNI